jgi:hypothetical protein
MIEEFKKELYKTQYESYLNMVNFYENMFNIKVEIHNNTSKIHPIIISNHMFGAIDYYFINKYILNNVSYKTILIKGMADLIPIVHNNDAFIVIDGQNKIKTIKEKVNKDDFIFMCPEGGVFSSLKDCEKSNKLCDKLNIPYFNNVLCPKINGYNTLVDIIQPSLITDITLNYVYKNGSILSNLNKFMISKIPEKLGEIMRKIIYYLSPLEKVIITINERPASQNIMDIFREKDKELEGCSKIFV